MRDPDSAVHRLSISGADALVHDRRPDRHDMSRHLGCVANVSAGAGSAYRNDCGFRIQFGVVSGITVGGLQIMNAATAPSSTNGIVANRIRDAINACSNVVPSGSNCTTVGYSATTNGSTVTIYAPGATSATPAAASSGTTLAISAFARSNIPLPYWRDTNPNPNQSSSTIPGENLRHTITPFITSYPYPGSATKAPGRTDCAASTCTYTEEKTNYANWYAYYRTRMQLMKTAASRAFAQIDKPADIAAGTSRFRVGLMSINNNNFTKYTMPIGTAFEGIMLSLALADRINSLRRQKEQSQAEALSTSLENQRIIREQNIILEEKVEQRTLALRESNEHLKRTQTQLVNAEKMASLGQLTAGIAHEINNPINFITSNIQPLKRNISEIVEVMQEYRALTPETAPNKLKDLKDREKELGISDSIDELDDIIGSISEGSNRTAEIVRGLRNFSRLDEDDLKEADLNDGIRNTQRLGFPGCGVDGAFLDALVELFEATRSTSARSPHDVG